MLNQQQYDELHKMVSDICPKLDMILESMGLTNRSRRSPAEIEAWAKQRVEKWRKKSEKKSNAAHSGRPKQIRTKPVKA